MGELLGQCNPLEQFVLLAKHAKGAAAVENVKQALEAPGVFVFGELLDMTNVQDLSKTESTAPYYHLLQLFAFGSYKDYTDKQAGSLPPLSAGMQRKLRMLSVVTLAETEKLIPYNTLQSELGLESVREVEDLIIEGISCGIMNGKLDQKRERFEVDFVIGRDIRQEDFGGIVSVLSSWCETCETVLNTIETQAEKLNEDKAAKKKHKEDFEATITDLKARIKNLPPGGEEDPDSRMDAERMDRRDKKGKGKSRMGNNKGFWPK